MSLQKWEYDVMTIDLSRENDLFEFLNEKGQDGWEMISCFCVQDGSGFKAVYHFKRPIEWETIVSIQES